MITWHFKFSLGLFLLFFYFLVNIGLLVGCLGLFVWLRNQFKPISIKKNIFFWESSGVGFFNSLWFFWKKHLIFYWWSKKRHAILFSNVLIQAPMKFIVTQIGIRGITFESSSRSWPPWNDFGTVDVYLFFP